MKSKMKELLVIVLFFVSFSLFAQEEELLKAKEKALNTSKNYTYEGNQKLTENNFIAAEVDYRKAISKSSENATAPYNLGNAYYNNGTFSEAFGRFKQAGETSKSKEEKHKAYHNMGNVFMQQKDYAKAVEAYKEALRNNPKDEETRYNLALAKEMQEKDDQNQDNQDQQDQEDKKDQDQNKEGDNKDQENQDQKDKGDEGDEGDKGEDKEDENKDGDGEDKEDQQKKPDQGEGDKPQEQQPKPNQLSKQQVENLLRAMQNAEKKVQDKIDAQKMKGAKIKNEKDW